MWYDNSNLIYHENLDNGWYTLTVTDVLDCQSVDSVYIESNSISCIDPVNTFTPNGDDYNHGRLTTLSFIQMLKSSFITSGGTLSTNKITHTYHGMVKRIIIRFLRIPIIILLI